MRALLVVISLFWSCVVYAQTLTIYRAEDGNFGAIDENQNFVIPPKFSLLKPFAEQLAVAAVYSENGDKYGFINTEGNWVIEAKYTDAHSFSQGLAAVYLNDVWFFINHAGTTIFPNLFESADQFEKGGCWVSENGYEKYFSRTGKIYSEYQNSPDLRNETGLTVVILDEKYGLMDSLGNELIEPQFNDLVWNQVEKQFIAYIEDREAILGKDFKVVNKVYVSQKKEKFGFVDFYGNLIVERKYDAADETDHNFYIVRIKKNYGIVNESGKEIIPCIYDQIDYFFEGHSTAILKGVEYDIDQFGILTKK